MNVKLYIIEGNREHLDGGAMFGNAPRVLWQRWIEADAYNRIPMATRCVLLQSDGINILIDTGISPFMEPKQQERYGITGKDKVIIAGLSKIGVTEEQVDYVILSHLHFDHAGGLMPLWPGIQDADWQLSFQNAKYIVHRRQMERSANPHPRDRASFIPGLDRKLHESGRLILIDDETDNIPDLRSFMSLEVSDGHTPGLLMPLIKTSTASIFFPSDMISGVPWVHVPLSTGFDRNAELIIDEKKKYLERASTEKWVLVFDHDPVTPAARILYDHEEGRFTAVPCTI